jgi:hypothetical protein
MEEVLLMRMTLNGMREFNPHLFDGIVLPDGLDVNILVDRIMNHCGDLYPYIQVPERVQYSIGKWFEGMYRNFYMMFRALNDDYNPIENTSWVDEIIRNNKQNGEDSNSTDFTSTPRVSTTTQNKTNAYNSGSGTPRNETTTSQTGEDKTNTTFGSNYDHNEDEKINQSRHGNIGVQTTSQIITEELRMRKFNLYDEIVNLFEKEFIVQVY